MRDAIEQFRAAIQNAGLVPPELVKPDGKLHRFPSSGKRGDDAGWYVLHPDAPQGGAFGCWRSGASGTWRANGRVYSPEEEREFRERIGKVKHDAEAHRVVDMELKANLARKLYAAAAPCQQHPYVSRKLLAAATDGLKVADACDLVDAAGSPLTALRGACLLVPARRDKEIAALQVIDETGEKRFIGSPAGAAFLFGSLRDAGRVVLAEGWATAGSVFLATKLPTLAAFSAGNLIVVAKRLREALPTTEIVLAADDDYRTKGNPGLARATEAAYAVKGMVAVPEFGATRPEGATDLNDLHRHAGPVAVQACIERAVQVESGIVASATPATSATDWPEPQPLDREAAQSEPYPLDALPGAVGAAVREYQSYGQQPVALVASSALAVVSLAAQGLADVARDERLTGPLSLNFLVIARSGERKTAADKALGAPLGEWEHERADALRDEIKRNRAALDAWAAEQDGLKAAIKSVMRKKPDEADKLRQRLMDHALQRPAELIAPRLRYEDVNAQSLAFMLATGHPSAALWSDEGGMVTGSHGMGKESLLGFMAGLNRLWDGGAIHHDRKQAQSVHLEGRRLTVSLMVQPLVLRELAQRGGGLTRGSGFLARYLVAAPPSTMGGRLYQEARRGMPQLAAFHQRIRELLDANLPLDDHGRLCPPQLPLSPGAFSIWREYHDEIERELKPLGDYATVCDFAAKSAENAARVAGCLHVFSGMRGEIPHETMQRAVTLVRWYLREALRVLDVLDEPQAWADARLLDTWLANAGDSPIRDVLRLGPSPLRDKARRNAAFEVLGELGRARIERDGRRDTLVRNPALSRFATATPATSATSAGATAGAVAGVATVAFASGQNPEIERGEL